MTPSGLSGIAPPQAAFCIARPVRADFSPSRFQGYPASRSPSPAYVRTQVVNPPYSQQGPVPFHQQHALIRPIHIGGIRQDKMTRADFAKDGLNFYALVQNMQDTGKIDRKGRCEKGSIKSIAQVVGGEEFGVHDIWDEECNTSVGTVTPNASPRTATASPISRATASPVSSVPKTPPANASSSSDLKISAGNIFSSRTDFSSIVGEDLAQTLVVTSQPTPVASNAPIANASKKLASTILQNSKPVDAKGFLLLPQPAPAECGNKVQSPQVEEFQQNHADRLPMFVVGEHVEARRWNQDGWYPGRIVAVNSGGQQKSYMVHYRQDPEDGMPCLVPENRIRKPGTAVENSGLQGYASMSRVVCARRSLTPSGSSTTQSTKSLSQPPSARFKGAAKQRSITTPPTLAHGRQSHCQASWLLPPPKPIRA
eukprot:gnl/MRDRNA2_/MRDRNA2_128819_c0_seq1.p1 gnl/MRDRNA2_/MRDRNA2_128819_c0~~gnl/MRDRNA2_/MRDRNA2_128819_c0_seq1.p1  ORF type:complete len:426 (-),score=65.16 gnl/MRDRNA2_/MRDRNA2_128819_c0_seq1:102-1379(-)